MEPWEKFEPQAKALIALYDKPITLINSQVKEFEEKRVAERKALIRSIYEELAEDVSDYIPLARIYEQKWENATTKEKAIREGILSLAIGTRQAVATIQAMHSEAEEKALLVYRDTLNLSEAISCISQYEAQKAESLPTRERGLKLQESRWKLKTSLPNAGAWIEIIQSLTSSSVIPRRSLRGSVD